jgi:hypothetical protein
VPETNPDTDDPAKLRDKLDAALNTNKKLQAQLALHEGGMSHLNDAQRRALVSQVGKGDMTKDNLVQAAKDLGFPTEPPAPATPPAGDGGQGQNGNNGSNQPPTNDANDAPDPSIANSLDQLDDMEKAHIMAMRAERGIGFSTEDYDKAMNEATTQEEVENVIRRLGPSVGIRSDVDDY